MTPNIPAPGNPEEHKAHPTRKVFAEATLEVSMELPPQRFRGTHWTRMGTSSSAAQANTKHSASKGWLSLISSLGKFDFSGDRDSKFQQERWLTKKTKHLSLFFKISYQHELILLDSWAWTLSKCPLNKEWTIQELDDPCGSFQLMIFHENNQVISDSFVSGCKCCMCWSDFQIKVIKLRHQIWTTEVFLSFGLVLLWFLCC